MFLQTPILLEAEKGKLTGVQIANTRAGASGSYVTGFDEDKDSVALKFNAKPGFYVVKVRYSSPGQQKGFGVDVNGRQTDGMFHPTGDGFDWQDAGLVELSSSNTLTFRKGWGWYDLDCIKLVPTSPPPAPKPVPARACDPQATGPAKALLRRIASTYGRKMISGQYSFEDATFIKAATGRSPKILGGDFIDYSPSRLEHGSDPKGLTEKMIAAGKAGSWLTFSWHWNAPSHLTDKMITDAQGHQQDARWYKGFYTMATTFDVSEALAHKDSKDYRLMMRDIDRIAVELRKVQKSGLPVLWRPLHEAEGGWFWWGAKGPEAFKKLWRLVYDRLTRVDGIHNLLWVYSSGVKPEWYPGDEYVDIVGIDAYPGDRSDALTTSWRPLISRFNGKKPLAVAEFGGMPDVARMFKMGAPWAYWVSWNGQLGPKGEDPTRLKAAYSNLRTIVR
jgi:mannan endo-1,4-beta-mannosidase